MAKRKKKIIQTLEEKLQEALVLESEQPYQIPENWAWVMVGNIVELISGQDINPKFCNDEGRGIPYILGASNINNNQFTAERWIETPKIVSTKGSILLSVKGTIGKLYIQKESQINISRQIMALKPLSLVGEKFLYYYLSFGFNESGTGLIPGIARKVVLQIKFPLPPLKEQQRITEQIESFFAKLDRVKELAQEALETFEDRKNALFHQAFTGKLTAQWREENGVSLDSWEEKTLKDVSDVRDGTHDSPSYQSSGFPLLTSKNLKNGRITLDKINYISLDDYNNINKRSQVRKGDILFAMIGTIGNPVLVTEEPNYAIKNVALFKDLHKINMVFLKYYLESAIVLDKMSKESKGTTQKFVSLTYLREFEIPVPKISEQQEIVRLLDSLLVKEEQIRDLVNVVEQVDLLKKTILAKAFRGELGTNDPSEESALNLLKEVLRGKE